MAAAGLKPGGGGGRGGRQRGWEQGTGVSQPGQPPCHHSLVLGLWASDLALGTLRWLDTQTRFSPVSEQNDKTERGRRGQNPSLITEKGWVKPHLDLRWERILPSRQCGAGRASPGALPREGLMHEDRGHHSLHGLASSTWRDIGSGRQCSPTLSLSGPHFPVC